MSLFRETVNPSLGIQGGLKPNVGQYGWTNVEAAHYNQMIQYVNECRDILEEVRTVAEGVEDVSSSVEEVRRIHTQVVNIKQDFDTKYSDFTVKYSEFQRTIQWASTSLDEFKVKYSDFNNKYPLVVQYAQQSEINANNASVSEGLTRGYYNEIKEIYEIIKNGYIYRGVWDAATSSSLPSGEGATSTWDVQVSVGASATVGGFTWEAGDTLVYVLPTNQYHQKKSVESTVSSVNGKKGNVVLTHLDVGAPEMKDGYITIPHMTGGLNSYLYADEGKIFLSNEHNTGSNSGLGYTNSKGPIYFTGNTEYRIYHENYKPTPHQIGALAVDANAVSAEKLRVARGITIGASKKTFDGSSDLVWTLDEIGVGGGSGGGVITADKLTFPRTLTIGNSSKSFDGSADVSWPLSEIGALGETSNAVSASKLASPALLTVGNSQKPFDGSANVAWSLADMGALSTTGSAASAKKLTNTIQIKIGNTARTFDGSANVTWTLDDIGAGQGGTVTWDDIANKPQYASRWPTYSEIGNKPSSLAGFGITGGVFTEEVAFNGTARLTKDLKISDYTVASLSGSTITLGDSTASTSIAANYGRLYVSDGSNSYRIYHEGFPPTGTSGDYVPTSRRINGYSLVSDVTLKASDLGAISTSGGRFTGSVTGTSFVVENNLNSAANTSLRFLNNIPTIAYEGSGSGSSSGFQITNGTTVKFKVGQDGELFANGLHKVYHANNKPSAADTGALSTSGGSLSGGLIINSGSGTTPGLTVGSGSLSYKAGLGVSASNPEVLLGVCTNKTTLNGFLRIGGYLGFQPTGSSTEYRIYHEGNKPTASAIGAIPTSGASTITATGTTSGTGLTFNGKTAIGGQNDAWLRINPHQNFASGVFLGSTVTRADGGIQVGVDGSKTNIDANGNIKCAGKVTASNITTLEVDVASLREENALLRTALQTLAARSGITLNL